MSSLHGFGLGIVSENAQGAVLDTFYPRPIAQVSDALSDVLSGVSGRLDAAQLAALSKALEAGEMPPGPNSRRSWPPRRAKWWRHHWPTTHRRAQSRRPTSSFTSSLIEG